MRGRQTTFLKLPETKIEGNLMKSHFIRFDIQKTFIADLSSAQSAVLSFEGALRLLCARLTFHYFSVYLVSGS